MIKTEQLTINEKQFTINNKQFTKFGRTYAETDIPVEAELIEPELTVSDTLEMLSEMGVDTDD